MKRTIALLILCMSIAMVTNPLLADEFIISTPFAFQERFPGGLEQIGFSEGDFLQEHFLPLELQSSTILPLKEIMGK